jgi:hypothetical protein
MTDEIDMKDNREQALIEIANFHLISHESIILMHFAAVFWQRE